MTYYKIPKNLNNIRNDNLVVGYHNGKSIVKNEFGDFFFVECEESFAPIGTVAEDDMLISIDKLSMNEQQELKNIYGNKEDY